VPSNVFLTLEGEGVPGQAVLGGRVAQALDDPGKTAGAYLWLGSSSCPRAGATMGTHARPEASAPNPPRSEWRHVRTVGLLGLENLAIAGGYVLLGWLGHRLTLAHRLPFIWPAGGFALAMLLVRGCSRWPAMK
jgi:hypothetical protein